MDRAIEEKIYAGVLGKIIGVYHGRPVEGWSYERIRDTFGEVDYFVNGKMNLDQNQGGNPTPCIIQPISQNGNNPPANQNWVILDATATDNGQPTIKKDAAGNLLTFSSVAVGNRTQWKLSS